MTRDHSPTGRMLLQEGVPTDLRLKEKGRAESRTGAKGPRQARTRRKQ